MPEQAQIFQNWYGDFFRVPDIFKDVENRLE